MNHQPISLAQFGLTKDQRDAISPEDFARPPDGYPCDTQAHLNACARLLGRAPEAEQAAIKARAIAIAERKGLRLPKSWRPEPAAMGADELMAADIEQAIMDALNDAYPDSPLQTRYVYVVDFNPAQRFVIFSVNGDRYRQGYDIDDATGTVSLTGKPVDVVRRTTWTAESEPAAEMGSGGRATFGEFELVPAEFAGGIARFAGKVFEAGQYPAQRISMTASDNARACQLFQPAPIKDTHDESQSVFAGRLGVWTEALAQGSEVHATLEMPASLVALFGSGWTPKVSVEIDRSTKRFSAIALLKHPQVSDAAVRAAFAAFAGARHSAADMKRLQEMHDHAAALGAKCARADMGARHSAADAGAIQEMHDLAVGQGASCPTPETTAAMSGTRPATAQVAASAKELCMNRPNLWERFLTGLGIKPEAAESVGITQARFEAALAEPSDTAADPELAKQMAQFAADTAQFKARMLDDQASKFANEVIYKRRKARAAQFEAIKRMYVTAANADGEDGTAKFAAGSVVEGQSVKDLTAFFDAQPEDRALLGDQIDNRAPATTIDRDARTSARISRAVEAYN